MTEIHGTCDDRFASVRNTMAQNFDNGLDVGASVAVTLDGELVVDLWGGHADEARITAWERDTITNVWSTTKTMTALCALRPRRRHRRGGLRSPGQPTSRGIAGPVPSTKRAVA